MDFIDLKKQYMYIKDDLTHSLDDIMSNARFIMGKEVNELELKLAKFVGVKHCITCSSGTDALLIPLMAWGVGRGDAVFVPSFTFYATAEVVSLVGATPIFVDVNEKTFCIDVEKLKIAIENVKQEGKLKAKLVIPVDLFGHPADHQDIMDVAKQHNLLVLEDAAQGFGGSINGKRACSFGDIAATSFFPAKPLGCYGDGGAIFTNNDDYNDLIRSIRIHGQGVDKYDNVRIGLNGRLDTIQAAVLLSKLTIFEKEIELRNIVASKYCSMLGEVLSVPLVKDGYTSSWAQFTCRANNIKQRAQIIETLKESGIPTAIYYPIPLHKQTAFNSIRSDYCDLSTCDALADTVFSIPMHPYLTDDDIEIVVESIKKGF